MTQSLTPCSPWSCCRREYLRCKACDARTVEKEQTTRKQRIDHQLARAGWGKGSLSFVEEFLLKDSEIKDPTTPYIAGDEFVDYALPDAARRPLGIVEAKKSSRDALEGERQAADYADRIEKIYGISPFIFLANGKEILFWHRGLYPPRKVSGFFSRDDMERLAFLDRFRETLAGATPRQSIVDRDYQHHAIKAVAENISKAHRHFLLVMATGTGKTRTVIALIELLIRHKWIQRVLFLADRRELVRQAVGALKEHLPDVPCARVEDGVVDAAARIHVATYPAMLSAYGKLSPGTFDLIICDESHRSIYRRYRTILEHFDAIQLGLTATPVDLIDRNTFQLFNCPDGLPTFLYDYDTAVQDGHLVPYRPVHVARTRFQIEGIQCGQLPAELQQQLVEKGIDPEELSFEGTELERRVTNSGTNDAIVREFMDHGIRDAMGTPAKTIIFAVSHRHAIEIYHSFNRLCPDLQRRGFAKVIDSHMERAEKTLDDFKRADFPRVAISVDMLDTGIDVPAIRNLVFAKPVFSKVKFWQMLGRGTRLWKDPLTGERKRDFLIIDHWDSTERFLVNREQGHLPGAVEPLPVRLFRTRLDGIDLLLGRGETDSASAIRQCLQAQLATLPADNIHVMPQIENLDRLRNDPAAWQPLDQARRQQLTLVIAPLLQYAEGGRYEILQFELLCERLNLAYLRADSDEIERLRDGITDQLERLPMDLPETRPHREALAFALSPGFWEHLDVARIRTLHDTFAPLTPLRSVRERGEVIRLTLPDRVTQRHWILYGPAGEGAFVETYRAQVEAFIQELAENSPALQRLRAGEKLTPDELDEVAHLIERPDLFITESRLREAYELPNASLSDFLSHILGVAKLANREEVVGAAFDDWVNRHPHLNAAQILFVRALRREVLNRARIASLDSLRQPPFNRLGDPESLFSMSELKELLALAA